MNSEQLEFQCQLRAPTQGRIRELFILGASSSPKLFQSLITKQDLLRLREDIWPSHRTHRKGWWCRAFATAINRQCPTCNRLWTTEQFPPSLAQCLKCSKKGAKAKPSQFKLQDNTPYGVAVDASGSMIYVTDYRNQALRAINLHTATVQTLYLCSHLRHPTSIRIEENAYLIVVCATTERVFRFGIRTSSSVDISPNQAGARHATQIQVTRSGNVLMHRASVGNVDSSLLSVRDQKACLFFVIDVTMPLHSMFFVQDTMYALLDQRLHTIHFELEPGVVKMLFLAVHTRKAELHATPSPMALLSFCLLRIIIGFTNRPFCPPILT